MKEEFIDKNEADDDDEEEWRLCVTVLLPMMEEAERISILGQVDIKKVRRETMGSESIAVCCSRAMAKEKTERRKQNCRCSGPSFLIAITKIRRYDQI